MGQEFLSNCGLERNKFTSWQGEDGEGPVAFSDFRISGDEGEDVQTAGSLCPAVALGRAKGISSWESWWVCCNTVGTDTGETLLSAR